MGGLWPYRLCMVLNNLECVGRFYININIHHYIIIHTHYAHTILDYISFGQMSSATNFKKDKPQKVIKKTLNEVSVLTAFA